MLVLHWLLQYLTGWRCVALVQRLGRAQLLYVFLTDPCASWVNWAPLKWTRRQSFFTQHCCLSEHDLWLRDECPSCVDGSLTELCASFLQFITDLIVLTWIWFHFYGCPWQFCCRKIHRVNHSFSEEQIAVTLRSECALCILIETVWSFLLILIE